MSDTLMLQERVKNSIQLGESHFREFKSAREGREDSKKPRSVSKICADIGEALVAFANADGGELLIGVEDDGSVSGVPHEPIDIEKMLIAPTSHVHVDSVLPLTAATRLILDGEVVLFFSVAKGTEEVYQLPDGRCVKRKDKSSMPETVKRILFTRQEIKSREYDRLFVDGATVNDLDLSLLRTIADSYLKGLSVELFLQQVDLAVYAANGLRLRMAALLLFASDISKWHPRSQVRIIKVSGTELKSGESYNALSDESVQGNIFQLIDESWKNLRPFLAYKTDFGTDARFEQKYIYPEWACREALVNAVAHRDYGIHNGTDIFIFDDRMEIKSPGALLSTLTIEDLEELNGAHESRNSMIAKILKENDLMRELGEGMKRMFELMEESELDKPKLYTDSNSFSITLPHKSVFSSLQEQWLFMFQQFNLSNLQKKIMVLGMNDREISPAEIYKAINTDDRNVYDREVTSLRKSKLLIEIRDNPSATRIARRDKIPKSAVPRFKVQVPGMQSPLPQSLKGKKIDASLYRKVSVNLDQRVFIGNLPYRVIVSELEKAFQFCGEILDVKIPLDYATNRPRGFAFITFKESWSAKKAINEMNGYRMQGRVLFVGVATDRNG